MIDTLVANVTACEQTTDRPRVAMVGCGYWGCNLVRNCAALGGLVAVSEARRVDAAGTSARQRLPVRTGSAL